MAITRRGVRAVSTNGGFSITATMPTETQVGDLLIVSVHQTNSSADITTPTGWNFIRKDENTNSGIMSYNQPGLWLYWRIADAAGAQNYQFTSNSGDVRMAIATAWTGHDPSTPIHMSTGDPGPTSGTSTSLTPTGVALTTTKPAMLVAFLAMRESGGHTALTAPSGMTEISYQNGFNSNNDFAGYTYAYEQQQGAAGSTGIKRGTLAAARGGTAIHLVAINPANAAPNAPTLTGPADNAVISSGASATFSWTHSDPEGDAQNGYALRRRIGTGAYEWWNAGTAAWVASEVINSSSTQSVTIPAGKWADGTTYNWSVATRGANNASLGAYSTQRNVSIQNSVTLAYTGAVQTYVVPVNVSQVAVEVWGAQGGGSSTFVAGAGGKGGYAKGVLAVTPGETLNVYVGGQGGVSAASDSTSVGGWNGGANGGSATGGGGGASDVRRGGTALADRRIAAGGGGGGVSSYGGTYHGAYGGGTVGGDAATPSGSISGGGKGGTQSAGGAGGQHGQYGTNGALGVGGAGATGGTNQGGGGGGGGYYGGGGGGGTTSGYSGGGGGGGSSYIGGVTAGQTLADQRTGNGQVVITAITPPTLTSPADRLAHLLTSGVTFQWSPPFTQASYALYRRAWGTQTKEWWNAGTSTWQGTEVFNTSGTANVTVGGAYWPAAEDPYYWSVAVKDAGGTTTPYASEYVLNPWEFWDGSQWAVGEDPIWVTSTVDSAQVPIEGFVTGEDYYWTVATKDESGQVGSTATPYTFTVGGVVPAEGWGIIHI